MHMNDDLKIDGKIYISSRRAAEMTKYSNDYIGQLCRSGKIDAHIMGRAWFIEEHSISEHKRLAEEALKERYKLYSLQRKKEIGRAPAGSLLSGASTTVAGFSVAEYAPLPQAIVFRRALGVLVALVMLVGVLSFGYLSLAPTGLGSGGGEVAGVYEAVRRFGSAIHGVYSWLANLTNSSDQFAFNNSGAQGLLGGESIDEGAETTSGIVVVPSQGLAMRDEEAKKRIEASFSDEVTIRPDQSGTAGVITPVFKENKGDDYVYVLVPVKESK